MEYRQSSILGGFFGTGTGFLLIIFILGFVGCSPSYSPHFPLTQPDWVYADMRLLDPADAAQPSQDLIAFYTRRSGDEIQFRLDFIDFSVNLDTDLYLVLDSRPGGTNRLPIRTVSAINWDYLVIIPADGASQVIDDQGRVISGVRLSVSRDPVMDSVVIQLKARSLGLSRSDTGVFVQVFSTSAFSDQVADESEPVALDILPPPPVQVLMAFWHVCSAFTPAQALRCWDGAHTGPQRNRHGLYGLVRAVQQTGIPVVLADFNHPANMSALDMVGGLAPVLRLAEEGLLILPETILPSFPGSPTDQALPEWLLSREDTEVRRVLSLFSFDSFVLSGFVVNGLGVYDYAHITESSQINLDGPSLELRKAIISHAFSDQPLKPLILGGDFSQLMWGEPSAALTSFSYLLAHPWIHFIDKTGLQTILSQPSFANATPISTRSHLVISEAQRFLLDAIQSAPKNILTEQALRTYLSLIIDEAPPTLMQIRQSYLGQIGHILAAARWANSPKPISDCSQDLDWDGTYECILATRHIYTTFEIEGGYIAFVCAINQTGIHLLVAPTYILSTGLGDPTTWKPAAGLAGEPDQILGAIASSPTQLFSATLEPSRLTLNNPLTGEEKIIRLTSNGLEITINHPTQDSYTIPLVLDPWSRFTPGWASKYTGLQTGDSFQWSLAKEIEIHLATFNSILVSAFTTSLPYLGSPEDPNFDYTQGFYLPFPLAAVQVYSNNSLRMTLEVNSP